MPNRVDKYKIPYNLYQEIKEFYDNNSEDVSLEEFIDSLINQGFAFEKYGNLKEPENIKEVETVEKVVVLPYIDIPLPIFRKRKKVVIEEPKEPVVENKPVEKVVIEPKVIPSTPKPEVKRPLKEEKPAEVQWGTVKPNNNSDDYKPYD